MTRILLADQDDLTKFGRDRGSGTALPTTDLRRGDAYLHTALGFMVYTGSAWRQAAKLNTAETSLATLAADHSAALYEGFQAWCTDTKARAEWDGARWLLYDTVWRSYSPILTVDNVEITYGTARRYGRYFRRGRRVACHGFYGVDTSLGTVLPNTGIWRTDYPAGLRPPVNPITWHSLPVGQSQVSGTNGGLGWTLAEYNGTAANQRMVFAKATGGFLTAGAAGDWAASSTGHWFGWHAEYEIA